MSESNQQDITVYSSDFCPFCHRAKALLARKGVDFEEIKVDFAPKVRDEMRSRAGGAHTVPQIFVADMHVGGCDDLYALERAGKLDPLLKSVA